MTLEQYLQQKKLNNTDFSKIIGVSPNAIGHYKSGRRTPRPTIMERIKQATGGKVTANDFYAEAQQ